MSAIEGEIPRAYSETIPYNLSYAVASFQSVQPGGGVIFRQQPGDFPPQEGGALSTDEQGCAYCPAGTDVGCC
ncbi:hypothetical protein BV898_10531 [Hypsibius exemplaris]|uniref:Uncharacterized protein n=1 Tax=Hypsibius exemplaris TaxID=2072580 RepID=A0A1W0WJA0_HYPEX|nr:hypothetical protein BV898_10531 [Hypsibius exemplaris]